MEFTYNPQELATQLSGRQNSCLFVATYSLSEVPIEARGEVVEQIATCSHFVVLFQDSFLHHDNVKYFGAGGVFRRAVEKHGQMDWQTNTGGAGLYGKRVNSAHSQLL